MNHARKTVVAAQLLCWLGLLATGEARAYINAGFRSEGDYRKYLDYEHRVDLQIGPFSAAIERNPRDAVAYYQRARGWEELPEYHGPWPDRMPEKRLDRSYQALADYSRAVELDPSLARAFLRRAFLRWSSRNYARAMEDFRQAVRLQPGSALAHACLAFACMDCPDEKYRDRARAVDHARQALAANGTDAAGLQVLAAVYAQAGDYGAAATWQAKAIAALSDTSADSQARQRLQAYQKQQPNPCPFRFAELEEASKSGK